MEYKKIVNKNNTIHVIDSNRFKEIHIVLYFTKEINLKENALGNLLCPNLTYSSKKYNTKSKIAIRGEELFGAKVMASFGFNGNTQNFIFGLQMLNPKYIEEKYFDESLDFLYEIIMNPNVDNNGFNKEIFDITKKDFINSIKSIKDNPNDYSSLRYDNLMFRNTAISKYTPRVKDIEKITNKSLYDFYKTIFNGDYKIDIIIYGEDALSLVDKVNDKFGSIKGNSNKYEFDFNVSYEKEETEAIDITKYKQSKLYIGYRLRDLNYHEKQHVLRLYNTILGSMSDSLLFNYVREKYSLCYSINSSYNRFDPALTIYAGINKNNYEETKQRIFEAMEFMKDEKVLKKYINQAKEALNTYINTYYDDIYSQINHYYFYEFELVEDVEELRKNINNVTLKELVDFNKKLELNVIFFMKGDE